MNTDLKINEIPLQYKDLAEFLGIELFVEFCKYFGGSYIYVPTEKTLDNLIRNKNIIEMHNNKIDVRTIAKKYNLSNNSVKQIIKKMLSDSN